MHRRVLQQVGAVVLAAALISACRAPDTLQPVRFEQWQRELAALQGQVVVVDVWATWCAPCIERFPHMVELHQRYKDRGVTFLSLSVDDREDRQALEEARRFLKRQNAAFRHYLLDENITQGFEKLDLMGIPAVLIYDRAGHRRYKLTGDDPNKQFTHEDVEDAIAAVLN